MVAEFHGVLVGRIHSQIAAGADDLIKGDISRTETRGEDGEPVLGETQHGTGHFVNFVESGIRPGCAPGERFQRLILEQVARGIDAINAEIVKRAAAQLSLGANIAPSDLHAEYGIEDARFAQLAGSDNLDSLDVRLFKVEAVSEYEIYL